MTIDIYYPQLSETISQVVMSDVAYANYYSEVIVEKYGIDVPKIPVAFLEILDAMGCGHEYNAVLSQQAYREISVEPGNHSQLRLPEFTHLWEGLQRCHAAIGAIIRENWSFREVVERQQKVIAVSIQKETYVNNQINIDRSQVGAVGEGAQTHNPQFQQNFGNQAQELNLNELSVQLAKLREALSHQATERDHYAAVVTISDAESAANQGNRTSAFAHLAKVGNWALDVATKIGVSVAVDAIKIATGMKS